MRTVKITDLFHMDLFVQMRDERYVSVRAHPTLRLSIANYTAKAQYDNKWNSVTTQCRGLIYDPTTLVVVARPFPKFFNLEQLDNEQIRPFRDFPITVMEKVDGSLGIAYPGPDGSTFVASRGSFTSDQAIHATAWLVKTFPDFRVEPGLTALFEIIYPENRIVVDYGQRDELVLLDVLSIPTGESMPLGMVPWQGRVAERYNYRNLDEVLDAGQPSNAEGFVILSSRNNERAKVKFAEYKRLHRILTNVSARTVWRTMVAANLRANETPEEDIRRVIGPEPVIPWEQLIDAVPDEFYQWLHRTWDRLDAEFGDQRREILRAWVSVSEAVKDQQRTPNGKITQGTRGHFADLAKKTPYAKYLFMKLDGKSFYPALWASLKPEHETPFATEGEDT